MMTVVLGAMLGAPLIAAFFATLMLEVRPSPLAWKICNAAFSVGAIVWGALIGYAALFANAFWDGPRAPSEALILMNILIGPAVALAGIALAWLGMAKRRIGLTLAGPVVTATAPMAAFLMLAILEKSLP